MKTRLLFLSLIVLLVSVSNNKLHAQNIDYITALKDTLQAVSARTNHEFFKIHCQSMIDVINAKTVYSADDENFLKITYLAFNNESDESNAKRLSSYLQRRRPFILSWESPTDGEISFSWVSPPKNWDKTKTYPLYVQLHGLWDVASNTIQYMTYPYLNTASSSCAFEDGFLLSPWGRGNMWYQGISETDIWECMAALEKHVSIDPARKYLCGHSMGGYGTWHIAQNSPHTWAAIGLHAAAIWISPGELGPDAVKKLKDLPIYFVCGTDDGLLSINQALYQDLKYAGNLNVKFSTFQGGHDYRQSDVEVMYYWMRQFVNNITTDNEVKTDISSFKVSAIPNPFNTTIVIKYSLLKSSNVNFEIFNSKGYIIEKGKETREVAGDYEISWTPENIPDGVYYFSLTTEYSRYSNRIIYRK